VIVWLQLLVGTVVVLWPGYAVARALDVAGPAESVIWSVAVVSAALAVTFAVHGSLLLTLLLVVAVGLVASFFGRSHKNLVTNRH